VAKQSLLQMTQAACGEMGLPLPVSVVDSTNLIAVQLLALANREAKEAMRRSDAAGGWQVMRKENVFQVQSTGLVPNCSFTKGSNVITIGVPATQAPQIGWVLSTSGGSNATGFPYPTKVLNVVGSTVTVDQVASASNTGTTMAFGQESYSLPSDYDYMITGTQWDRGFRWQVLGPLTPQEWQVLKSGLSPTGPRRRFRIMGGKFFLDPIPYDSNTLVYEYHSNGFALAGDGVTVKTSFTADSDTYALPDDLLVMGMIWRWRRAKGLDYGEEFKTYDDAMSRELARDASAGVLRLDTIMPSVALLTANQIPDTGFGA